MDRTRLRLIGTPCLFIIFVLFLSFPGLSCLSLSFFPPLLLSVCLFLQELEAMDRTRLQLIGTSFHYLCSLLLPLFCSSFSIPWSFHVSRGSLSLCVCVFRSWKRWIGLVCNWLAHLSHRFFALFLLLFPVLCFPFPLPSISWYLLFCLCFFLSDWLVSLSLCVFVQELEAMDRTRLQLIGTSFSSILSCFQSFLKADEKAG